MPAHPAMIDLIAVVGAQGSGKTTLARVAARKGHSFFLYFLFSLVFFPAALLVAYLVRDRRR